jgi:uncharacterized iron-regulated membrane protein
LSFVICHLSFVICHLSFVVCRLLFVVCCLLFVVLKTENWRSSMSEKSWPDYRAVWRWHFYAGLLCIPFVIVLSVSGLIYLFKPQIEAWNDRHYDNLTVAQSASASDQIHAAISSIPGSSFSSYELPKSDSSAARVVVRDGQASIRVYVNPQTLQVMHSVPEDDRIMRWIFRLHGDLLMGNRGSNLVEMAACWTIVLLITGLYLWWPRNSKGMAGVLYSRLFSGSRLFWRDIHAVVGMWISFLAIFLLLTGLPWAKFWGDYFKTVRQVTGTAVAKQDWSHGSDRSSANRGGGGEHAGHGEHVAVGFTDKGTAKERPAVDLTAVDRIIVTVIPLQLEAPVIIAAPGGRSATWTAKSNTANRPRRVSLDLNPTTGEILKREDFKDRHWIDRAVGFGVAAHEGALFGWFNQLLGVLATLGLILLSVSAVVLWWKRRDWGVLGAPKVGLNPKVSWGLVFIIAVIGICLPLFAASLAFVMIIEWLVLSRILTVRTWLGLRSAVGQIPGNPTAAS